MKKKSLICLIVSTLLISCQNINTSSSEFESSSDSSIIDSSSIYDSSLESSESNNESSNEESSSSEEISSIEESSTLEELTPKRERTDKNINNFLGSDNDLYRINITTENEEFLKNNIDEYTKGSLSITEQDETKVILDSKAMGIKLRGNSTRTALKKPFKIKFDKKQSLFGLKAAKKWVLLANYYDKSNIRNYLAYLTANKLTYLGFQPSSIFVDVYLNNNYYGLFLLCEQMEENKGRVDIEDKVSANGLSSFFLEVDERIKDEYKDGEGKAYFYFPFEGKSSYYFSFKYPSYDDYLEYIEKNDEENISKYNNDISWLYEFLSNALYSPNYTDYLDISSFIDYYLVEEFFKNVDVGSTSQFYYIDSSQESIKLTAGPVWDFDIASGAIDDHTGVYNMYYNSELFVRARDPLYAELFLNDSFTELVKKRYQEVRDEVFLSVFDEIDIAKEKLEKAQDRNVTKWPLSNERSTWVEVYALGIDYLELASINEHYDYLTRFLKRRLNTMDYYYGK